MENAEDSVNVTSVMNSTVASLLVEATTLLNNLTTTIQNEIVGNTSTAESHDIVHDIGVNSTRGILGQPMIPESDDDTHKNPELKYFSTVIIIFMGLTILIVPVFCFVGVVCARARVFRTVREVAGRGWGFNDAEVPYAEFGSDDYTKDKSDTSTGSSSRSRNCDVKVLVADDNRLPSSGNNPVGRSSSFFRYHNNSTTDDEEDISSLPPTFVHSPVST